MMIGFFEKYWVKIRCLGNFAGLLKVKLVVVLIDDGFKIIKETGTMVQVVCYSILELHPLIHGSSHFCVLAFKINT
jgi:hypothetical protein